MDAKTNGKLLCILLINVVVYSIITNKKRWDKILVLNVIVHVKKCKKNFLFTISILNLTTNMNPMMITTNVMSVAS